MPRVNLRQCENVWRDGMHQVLPVVNLRMKNVAGLKRDAAFFFSFFSVFPFLFFFFLRGRVCVFEAAGLKL